MSVVIENIEYTIEDEDLPEIEYFEIMSIEKIIKNNPTFIAFTREEIFNELFDFFKSSNKADSLTNLFYKNDKTNTINYVFVADASKKDYECFEEDMDVFVKKISTLTKLQYKVAQTEKNKYFFSLTYNLSSDKLRLKPFSKTTLQLQDTNQNINIFFPVDQNDDTNIPVLSAYYKKPSAVLDDYLTQKVIAFLEKPVILNHTESEGFKEINKLLKYVKPKFDQILKDLDIENETLDFNTLNAFLQRFDTSMENIDKDELLALKVHLESFLVLKEHKTHYKKYKLQDINVSNDKIEFFNRIQHIHQLLSFSEKTKQDYELMISTLQNEKMDLNAPPLLYNNINDLVHAVINNVVSLEDILENISANRNVLIIDHSINTLNGINKNEVEDIQNMLNHLTDRFHLLKDAMNKFYDFHFIELFSDLKEIKEGNNFEEYEGIPDVYKNDSKFEGMVEEEMEEIEVEVKNKNNMELEKYWLSIKYKDATGFVEMLKIVLPILFNVQQIAKLPLNFNHLCEELYNKFSWVPTKYFILFEILQKADIKVPDQYIKEIMLITPKVAIANELQLNEMSTYVVQGNQIFIEHLFKMFFVSLGWWSMQIQEDINSNSLMYDENQIAINHFEKWAVDGLPVVKDSKQGVLVYLASILEEYLEDSVYTVPTSIVKNIMKLLEEDYSEMLSTLRKTLKDIDKKNKGHDTYKNLLDTIKNRNQDKLLADYIDALIFMPSYKYKKIHKFLLGCCLQQIGKVFVLDNDLIATNRKDLLAVKSKYAKHREINKIRANMFLPTEELHEEDMKGVEMILPDIVHSTFIKRSLDDWLENMRGISPLLSEDKIDLFKKGTKESIGLCNSYLECLAKSSGNKLFDVNLLFNTNKHKNILFQICTIFKTYKTDHQTEVTLLNSAIVTIQTILKHMDEFSNLVDEYNIQDILRIKHFLTCRALCLPFNPDIARNSILNATLDVSNTFVKDITKVVYTNIAKYLKMIKMPTMEENVQFINSIREQNKNKTLNVMNTKTQDERNLMNTLKKIGLKYEDGNEETVHTNPEKEQNDDEIEQEGEAEFLKGDEEEYNEDDLDTANYGFIYS